MTLLLLQMSIVLLVTLLCGWIARKFGQTRVVGEIVGGILLVFGLFTRSVAFILSGEMAFAYWMTHAQRNIFPILNGGDAAILYCFLFLYRAFEGGGGWSLDQKFWKR